MPGQAFTSGSLYGRNDQTPEVLIKRLFRRISEVSTLPAVAIQIMEVANDSSTGAEDLHEAVQFDAALAMRIMRTVNSSYYSLQNKVGDLKLAITLLGFKEIRNLAMTAYIAQLFKKDGGHGSYTREGLWNHLIGVGTVARLIAETSRRVPPREAYLAGLLHDLGIILLDQYLNKPFIRIIDSLGKDSDKDLDGDLGKDLDTDPDTDLDTDLDKNLGEETPICALEREILGFDHAELGEFVASQWNLPEHLVATIRYHHSPLEYVGEHQQMVYVVALANFLCNTKNLTARGVGSKQVPPPEVFHGLGLDKTAVTAIWGQLDETLKAADIMAMVRKG